jgi:hypothetical protein
MNLDKKTTNKQGFANKLLQKDHTAGQPSVMKPVRCERFIMTLQ